MNSLDFLPRALELHRHGKLDEARILYEKVLCEYPSHPDTLNLLGCLLCQSGDMKQGEVHLLKALQVNPSSASIWYNLANAQRELDRIDDSIQSLRKTIHLDPSHSEAWDHLCALELRRGFPDEAEEAGREATKLGPHNPSCWNNLGNVLHEKGEMREAISCFCQALERNPKFTGALNNLGVCYLESGKLNEAYGLLQKSIALDPSNAESYSNLGSVVRLLGDGPGSLDHLEKALSLDPSNLTICNNLALSLKAVERIPEAIEVLSHLLSLSPDYPEARMNLAAMLVDMGRQSEAISHYDSISQDYPELCEAYRLRGLLTKWSPENDGLQRMLELLKSTSLPALQRLHLHFALGKAYDDLGEIENSFYHYEEANKWVRDSNDYDPKEEEASFKRIEESFDKSFFDRVKAPGCQSELPIFILGMPRSGTSLIEQILSSHREVFGGGERTDLSFVLFGPNSPLSFATEIGVDTTGESRFEMLGQEYYERVLPYAQGLSHITDKMPQNFRHIGLIHLILPRAPIIHCVREPMDTCFSCFTNYFSESHRYTYDQRELGEYYRLYENIMTHWDTVLPGRILKVSYEALLENPERETRRILEYCSLSWDDQCMKFYETDRAVTSMSSTQVRQPLYKAALRKWKPFEKYFQPLRDTLAGN
ncbi:tetratricopeptide repeat protein [bacterium]|jgi:tetratricopeptide (TPR) repeat protein|nr:tetratricopeptide repeat protein [bacterium]